MKLLLGFPVCLQQGRTLIKQGSRSDLSITFTPLASGPEPLKVLTLPGLYDISLHSFSGLSLGFWVIIFAVFFDCDSLVVF